MTRATRPKLKSVFTPPKNGKGVIRENYQEHLVPGKKYRVMQPFLDAAKSVHRAGETWTYQGYVPSGFSGATAIFIVRDNGVEDSFGIDWESSENNLGLDNLKDYIQVVS